MDYPEEGVYVFFTKSSINIFTACLRVNSKKN